MKYILLFLTVCLTAFTLNSQIVINEINYKDALGFETKDWIELYNNGASTVDMSNWVFKDSDDLHEFVIPNGTMMPGGSYLVLAQFKADFDTYHIGISPVLGDFTFGLSGGGELIRLFNNNGDLMDFVEYDDEAPWPIEPDGNGPTLELRNPIFDNNVAASWAASVSPADHGTPGAINSTYVLGTNDFSKLPVTVYPNPLRSNSTVSVGENGPITLVVFDVLGREVMKKTTSMNQITLNRSDFVSGTYILKISSENDRDFQIQKLIVK